MDYQEALTIATQSVAGLAGHTVDVLSVRRPRDIQGAIELSKIVSKLSPIVGNLLEYTVVQYLNETHAWPPGCRWIRQDPGFPDNVLEGMAHPQPGIEIKTWFPLATEITARFRDSQAHFTHNQVKVALISWIPEFVIAGEPKIIGVWIGDALDVARTRDNHYHRPPEYLVIEPEDTSERTANLQQTNCNGLRFQGNASQLSQARAIVDSWGSAGQIYRPDREYQALLRELTSRFPYRLDTNFAKMDRIVLPSLETFKTQMLNQVHMGQTIKNWSKAVSKSTTSLLATLVEPDKDLPVH